MYGVHPRLESVRNVNSVYGSGPLPSANSTMKTIKEKGTRVPYMEQYVDGWQAYLVGRDLRSNPYKRKPESEEFKRWKEAFLAAKHADEIDALFGICEDKIVQQYWGRHQKHK